MVKYTKLGKFLSVEKKKVSTLSYSEIERILDVDLPQSAFDHREWWANSRSHTQANSWLDAGWRVNAVELGESVTFHRIENEEDHIVEGYEYDPNWDYSQEWFYEGNVTKKIADYMEKVEDFTIHTDLSLGIYRRGPDIKANKGSSIWRIEVKGYPSNKYVRDSLGGKKGELKKRTRPNSQARHWFSEALFQVLYAKSKNPQLEIGLGFTNHDVYLTFLKEMQMVREAFHIHTYIVHPDNIVICYKPSDEIDLNN